MMSSNRCDPDAIATARRSWLGICLIGFFLLIYLVPLNDRPLFIPDESRYAEIPREMIASEDWTRLRQVGLRYYEKPPLGYWLNAASISVFGQNPFAVRLPVALSTGLMAFALFLLVWRVRKNATRAAIAAMIFLSCLEVFIVGTYAVLDAIFALFAGCSMLALFLAKTTNGRANVGWSIAAGIACAAAFLTKGFTALVIPALTALVWLPWERRGKALLTAWIVPLITAVIAVLPAAWALHASNPEYWHYFFWVEHIQRFLDPGAGQHREPIWYFVPILLLGTLPWSFFLPPALLEVKNKIAHDPLTRFCLCWFVVPFLFFSVCGGKLPTYILPCFAPFAILMADALSDSLRGKWLRYGALAGSALCLLVLAGTIGWLLFATKNELLQRIAADPSVWSLCLAVLSAALCLGAAAGFFTAVATRPRAFYITALSLGSFAFVCTTSLPTPLEDNRSPSRLLESVVPQTPPNALLVSDRNILSAVAWHYQRDDILFFEDKGELDYGLRYPEAQGRYVATADEARTLILEALAANRPVAACFRNDFLDRLKLPIKPSRQQKITSHIWVLYLPPDSSPLSDR